MLTNKALPERPVMGVTKPTGQCVMGKWKIIFLAVLNGAYVKWKTYNSYQWQLYDMKNDRAESKDLSEQYPDVVKKMSAVWDV